MPLRRPFEAVDYAALQRAHVPPPEYFDRDWLLPPEEIETRQLARLRVAYMEAGCGWLPSWLHRIEEHVELAGWLETPDCKRSPLEYFQRNCWITTEPDEPHAYHVVDEMGDGRILFETDYPHPDSKYPRAVSTFLSQEKLSDETKRKILWDNAVDFYRFPDSHLPTSFEEATG